MNFNTLVPIPTIAANKPIKVSPRGNLFKIPIVHTSADGTTTHNVEIWATREAVQKHFGGMSEEPQNYQLKKFARQMYEKQLRLNEGHVRYKGSLYTTNDVTHGDPHLWPHTISHPEVKL